MSFLTIANLILSITSLVCATTYAVLVGIELKKEKKKEDEK